MLKKIKLFLLLVLWFVLLSWCNKKWPDGSVYVEPYTWEIVEYPSFAAPIWDNTSWTSYTWDATDIER
jgi:hypothetical protein